MDVGEVLVLTLSVPAMCLLLIILVRLEEWLREDANHGFMPQVVDLPAVGGELAGDFIGGRGPRERLGVGVPGVDPAAEARL